MNLKLQLVTDAIVQKVQMTCSCDFTIDKIVDGAFSCRSSQLEFENTVVYRAKITPLVHVLVIDANDIEKIIEAWVQSGASVMINGLALNLDPNCTTTIESYDDEECAAVMPTTITTETLSPSVMSTVQPSSVNGDAGS